jgi:hypothetical protein
MGDLAHLHRPLIAHQGDSSRLTKRRNVGKRQIV